jgi:hypothetical protein
MGVTMRTFWRSHRRQLAMGAVCLIIVLVGVGVLLRAVLVARFHSVTRVSTQDVRVKPPSEVVSVTSSSIAVTTAPKPPPPVASVVDPAPRGFGVSTAETLMGLSPAALAGELDRYQMLGVTWLRVDVTWTWIQPDSSKDYHWTDYDRVIKAARAKHFNVLGVIAYTPAWARVAGCGGDKCRPASAATYGAFAGAVAAHYAPMGVHAWEIWNEPNQASFFAPAADAAAYVQLLRAAYPAIKAADKNAIVVTGGLAPTETAGGNIELQQFAAQIYALGGKGYFDALGIHPYSFPVPASYSAPWNAWTQMTTTIRSLMVRSGDGSKQIWPTEYGAPTGGPGVGASTTNYQFTEAPDHVDEALQAFIARDVVTQYRILGWAGPLFWYGYEDLGTSLASAENFYGLVRADGSPKPALEALRTTIRP